MELAVSAAVFDLALDGYGYVHAIPQSSQWVPIHSVRIATNAETLSTGDLQVWAGSHIKLQPGTHFIYTSVPADSGNDSVSKWDITSGTANFLYQPNQAYIAVAGNLWFADDGVTAYTAWGSVAQASPVQAQDLAPTGQQLTVSPVNDYSNGSMTPSTQALVSVDESDATHEILAVDAGFFACNPTVDLAGCLTGIDIYDSTSLTQTGHYSLPTVTIAGEQYAQRALFVFHSSDGTGRFALSTLLKESSTPAQYYLTTF